jgi:chorismate synthase
LLEKSAMLRYSTAGESHGKALVALVEGFPAGVEIHIEAIDAELRRRQGGYGRGGRQQIESDRVEIFGGLRGGKTIGSPIALKIDNRDCRIDQLDEPACPRPGHGDLSGSIKCLGSIRDVSERASARETAARVAAGALVRQLFAPLGITAIGYVVELGPISVPFQPNTLEQHRALRDRSEFYTLDPGRDAELKTLVDQTAARGDTLGGIVEVRVEGVPFGLGSHAQWNLRLDGRLAGAVMAVPGVKGVEIGDAFASARRFGAEVHDPIGYDASLQDTPSLGFVRPTNRAGGIEAGMSNSQPIVVRAACKPINTLRRPLDSVNLETLRPEKAPYQRSDVCAVAATSCVAENVVAFEIAKAALEKFGGDSLAEVVARWRLFHEMAKERLGIRD